MNFIDLPFGERKRAATIATLLPHRYYSRLPRVLSDGDGAIRVVDRRYFVAAFDQSLDLLGGDTVEARHVDDEAINMPTGRDALAPVNHRSAIGVVVFGEHSESPYWVIVTAHQVLFQIGKYETKGRSDSPGYSIKLSLASRSLVH